MTKPPAQIGDPIDAILSPALVINLDAFEANMGKMASFAAEAGVRLRPHAKTHKSADIALLQIPRGAVGVCCQTLSEACRRCGNEIDVVVEIDIGQQRCGPPPGDPALRLSREIAALPHLRFAGILPSMGPPSTTDPTPSDAPQLTVSLPRRGRR